MSTDYELVHTITDFYDGPRSGVADFQNKPCFYQCVFDESADDWSAKFQISPIDSETFQLALEDWAIWRRWEKAYYAGQTTLKTHPALPEDRQRFEELRPILTGKLKIDPNDYALAYADFRRRPGTEAKPVVEVKWTVIRSSGS